MFVSYECHALLNSSHHLLNDFMAKGDTTLIVKMK